MINTYISTKSPYMLFSEETTYKYVVFHIHIYTGDEILDKPINPTYKLVSSTFDNKGNIEISPFIDSRYDQEFNGIYLTEGSWMSWRYYLTDDIGLPPTTFSNYVTHYALPGYTYFTDGLNFGHQTNGVMMDGDEIQIEAGGGFRIPIFIDVADEVILKNTNGLTIDYFDIASLRGDDSIDKVFYYHFGGGYADDIGTLEVKSPNGIRVIKIVEVDECKYIPNKVTFLNRYGVLQDLWFFKKKEVSVFVKQDEYKRNLIDISTEDYNTNAHQTQVYNKLATEEMTLNSGFVPESFNYAFKQLVMSDKVWVTGDINGLTRVYPANVKTSEIIYKTKTDEKLINQTITLDLAFDTINNIA